MPDDGCYPQTKIKRRFLNLNTDNSEPDAFHVLRNEVLALRDSPQNFERVALKIFRLQAKENVVYQRYLELISCQPESVKSLHEVPFLPISFFKSQRVVTGRWVPETFFESSGTSQMTRSRHYIQNGNWYRQISAQIFEDQVGPIDQFQILGLLPTYLQNPHSSLIYMVEAFGEISDSGAVLTADFARLISLINKPEELRKPLLLFSVTYALLKLADLYAVDLSDIIVIETGGMKGLGEEIPKDQFMDRLRNKFKIKNLYSEYGMTELLSQAYSDGSNYRPGFTMKVMVRQPETPLNPSESAGRGIFNIVDLANIHSCSFVATDDLGEVFENGRFQVHGRLDGADLRGCNLLFSN